MGSKFLESIRQNMRLRGYALSTEKPTFSGLDGLYISPAMSIPGMSTLRKSPLT